MQGLQEIWELPLGENSWATAGYLGAINSGDATCGLLVGSSVAIGLRSGQGKTCLPLEDKEERNKAVSAVNALYKYFIEKFGATHCQKLIQCDFSKPEELDRYVKEEIYKNKCFNFFNFVMNRFIEMEKQEKDE